MLGAASVRAVISEALPTLDSQIGHRPVPLKLKRTDCYTKNNNTSLSYPTSVREQLSRTLPVMAARSPLRQTNAEALASSQQAIRYRQENASTNALPLLPFLSRNESPEQWTSHENLLYSCLRTGDDKTAHSFLEKLASRFGKDDERVMGLRGLYQEAMADDDRALLQILQGYDDILAEDPTNTVLALEYSDAPNDR